MATFSENQVRQLYVANKLSSVSQASEVGTLDVLGDAAKSHMYFQVKGAAGITRSDLIDVENILYAKVSDADTMETKLKKAVVSLDSRINEGNPISGQDYFVKIIIDNYITIGDGNPYVKYGLVHAYTGMTKETFYETLKESFEKNFSRDLTKFFNFSIEGAKANKTMETGGNSSLTITAKEAGAKGNKIKFQIKSISAPALGLEITNDGEFTTIAANLTNSHKAKSDLETLVNSNPVASKLIVVGGSGSSLAVEEARTLAGGTATGVIIEEVPQEWTLGIKEQVPVNFHVSTSTVDFNKEEVNWSKIILSDQKEGINNGHKMADLEYFCMGERADLYRNIGWPHSIETKYLVDPSKKYNVIDIHYAYVGANEGPQKSEKTITILVPKVGMSNSTSNVLANSIVDKINKVAGLKIEKLSVA